MDVGFSLSVGWHMVSILVVFGSLAGIAYCIWDAHKEAKEASKEEFQTVHYRTLRSVK